MILMTGRHLTTAAVVVCTAAALALFAIQGRLVEALPRMLALAASALGIGLLMRPNTQTEAMQSQWRQGYLECLDTHQAQEESNVTRLADRR